MAQNIAKTPLMKQYEDMKKKHPDAILLFRVGDFYETFGEDAIATSEILGITLTRCANGKAASIELAGFPHHALDTYLPKIVRAGRRVCICEQLEDPKLVKKLAKNGVQNQMEESRASALIAALITLHEVMGKLSTFEAMRQKAQEFRALASKLGISPRKAFEECGIVSQPTLFG